MSAFGFILDGRKHSVVVEEHASGPRYVVEGETFSPTVQRLAKGRYKVTIGAQVYEFTIQNGLVVDGVRPMDLEVRRDRPVLERKGGASRRGSGQIKPPMPGKIVEVRVKEGQDVKEGDVLVILEAMKMQNDIKAPASGKVSKVHVAAGTNVEASTVLVEIVADGA